MFLEEGVAVRVRVQLLEPAHHVLHIRAPLSAFLALANITMHHKTPNVAI